jgi:uncharacterized protein (TIGR02145 family)
MRIMRIIFFKPVICIEMLLILSLSCRKDSNPEITDADGNVYHAIEIGSQVWLKENLNSTRYNDGTTIPLVTDSQTWYNLTSGACCDYNKDASNAVIYGKLYNWYVVDSANSRNVCPRGWHVPNLEEWVELEEYLGGTVVAGGKLKETDTLRWLAPNTGATDETGFAALPGGRCYQNEIFSSIRHSGYWWTSSKYSFNGALAGAHFWYLANTSAGIMHSIESLKNGYSVRCLQDGKSNGKIDYETHIPTIDETSYWSNPNVNQYVKMLKDGTYNTLYIPHFLPKDIDSLLLYSNDFQIIKRYPLNPFSSYTLSKARLGECLMWTVESIRLNYDKTMEIDKFPSLAPQLYFNCGTLCKQVASLDDLNRAYNLYKTWWSDNKAKDFSEFRYINPLEDDVLRWW